MVDFERLWWGVCRNAASSDEIQLRIDPVHGDLDEEIDGLHSRVRMLKGVRFDFPSGLVHRGA